MKSNLNCLETILRNKVFTSSYYKLKCFSLNLEGLIDLSFELRYIGSLKPSTNQPTEFLCLLVKFLQISPEEEIIDELLNDPENKYLRALTVFYIRLTYNSIKIYKKLEKLYNDYKKLVYLDNDGEYKIMYMDELVENLIENESVFDIVLPKIIKRSILEENGQLKERKSVLENEINFGKFKEKIENDDDDNKNNYKNEEEESEEEENEDIFEHLDIPKGYFEKRKRSEENNNLSEINKINKKFKKNDDEIIKNNKTTEENEEKNVKNDDLKNLDPNSDEYWLALRKKLGLK
jgi:pre-mRNA-splicing factor 38A